MGWQQQKMLHVPAGHDEEKTRDREKDVTAHSSILQYIKTLTAHQMNAKQQRMDRYLQQKVKHVQSKNDVPVRHTKPFRHPSATGKQCLQMDKTLKSKVKSKCKSKVKRSDQERVTTATKTSLFRSKRDKGQEKKQWLKPQHSQQPTVCGSLDRFKFHKVSSQKPMTSTGEKYHPTKHGQQIEMQDLTYMPQSTSAGLSIMTTDMERRPVQELKSLTVKAHTTPSQAQALCSSLIQPFDGLSPERGEPSDHGYALPQQAVFIPAYDHLVPVMDSIYF